MQNQYSEQIIKDIEEKFPHSKIVHAIHSNNVVYLSEFIQYVNDKNATRYLDNYLEIAVEEFDINMHMDEYYNAKNIVKMFIKGGAQCITKRAEDRIRDMEIGEMLLNYYEIKHKYNENTNAAVSEILSKIDDEVLKKYGNKIMFWCLSKPDDPLRMEIFNFLVNNKGLNVNIYNVDKTETLLTFVITPKNDSPHKNIIDTLVESNVDVNAKAINEQTALMKAAYFGLDNIFNKLIEYGADVYAKDRFQQNVFDFAISGLKNIHYDLNDKIKEQDINSITRLVDKLKKYDTIIAKLIELDAHKSSNFYSLKAEDLSFSQEEKQQIKQLADKWLELADIYKEESIKNQQNLNMTKILNKIPFVNSIVDTTDKMKHYGHKKYSSDTYYQICIENYNILMSVYNGNYENIEVYDFQKALTSYNYYSKELAMTEEKHNVVDSSVDSMCEKMCKKLLAIQINNAYKQALYRLGITDERDINKKDNNNVFNNNVFRPGQANKRTKTLK